MIQSISHHDLEIAYANAVNTIQSQMNFQDAVAELEQVARAGHGKWLCGVVRCANLLGWAPHR